MIRRAWIALATADIDLVTAAKAGGRLTCTTLARRRDWWIPESVGSGIHLHLSPRAGAARLGADWKGVLHWAKPLVPFTPHSLTGAVEDALAHIAVCQPFETALVLWESAVHREKLSAQYLRGLSWTTRAARHLADVVSELSDSGLETLVVVPLRRLGLRVRQQVKLAGHLVDILVGDRLVVQIDGYEFHVGAQRTKDIAHDAELRLRGYTVLRVSYAQVVHDWPLVERTILRAVAAGLDRVA